VAEESNQPRRIRKVETVREKAEKTAAAGDKPRRFHTVRRGAGSSATSYCRHISATAGRNCAK